MKPVPIKVEASHKSPQIVEWMLHNTCNYNCSFCPSHIKDGSRRWFDLETYTNTCKRAMDEASSPIWFKFTGGEPTLYPKLPELLSFVKAHGSFTYIISNGARTIRYWKELADSGLLDGLALSYHPEQTSDYLHIIDVVNLFKHLDTFVTVNITCIPEFFDKAIEAMQVILNNCATTVNLQQINDEVNMSKYTPEQRDILLKHSMVMSPTFPFKKKPIRDPSLAYHSGKIRMIYDDGSVIEDDAIRFIKNDETFFYGWKCSIGQTMIRIEHDKVQRSVCGQGSSWTIYDDHLFAKDASIICKQAAQCTCTLDVIAPKER